MKRALVAATIGMLVIGMVYGYFGKGPFALVWLLIECMRHGCDL